MKKALLFLAMSLFVTAANADDVRFPGPYFGEVVRVIDGDTFEARIEIWPTVSATVSVRLRGFDAPEILRPACEEERYQGALAKTAMEEVLPVGQSIALTEVGPDSFAGRVVADVQRVANVNRVSIDTLLENRDAIRPWNPDEPPIDWCD
jgi:endonuclease YncB( thermonuclease family)